MNLVKAVAQVLPIVAFALMAGGADPARAGKLPARQCLELDSEKRRLLTQSAQRHFEKGPEWAKVNLGEQQINRVKRLISVNEALEFRCDARGMEAMKKRFNSPKFAKWRASKPPLPSRNPIFVELREQQ